MEYGKVTIMLLYARNVLSFVAFHWFGVLAALWGGVAIVAVAGRVLAKSWPRAKLCLLDGGTMALCVLPFCLGDWAWLRLLPYLRLSFARGSEILPPLGASLVVRILLFWGLFLAALLTRWRRQRPVEPVDSRGTMVLFLVANLCFTGVQLYAYGVEPLWVEMTELAMVSPDLDGDAPLVRVVQLTDTHIERNSYRERQVVAQVKALGPDIIVLTGDYLNLSRCSDPVSAAHFRTFIQQFDPPYGIYAVRGSVDPPGLMAELMKETGVVWLEQEAVTVDVRGQPVTLIGVACSHNVAIDGARLDRVMGSVPENGFNLLLYHSPDLIREAKAWGIDLYVGGHTHGGQLRLPFYGAIVTNSEYGKQYEAGLFVEGGTTMYINRGLGFEGGGMPRARFLCRPEILSVDLFGARE